MRKADSTNRPSAGENYWRKRPSEIQGYNRTLYTTTKDNEYIRVDFNLRERRVRLYIEDNDEGGNPYFSVITNGKITVERNATTGRITELKEKFNKRGFIFSTIPNKDVIGLINNNYGIGIKGKNRAVPKAEEKIKEREQVKKKYSAPSSTVEIERDSEARGKAKKSRIIDVIDTLIGIILCVALYTFNHNFVTLGVLSAFIGIFLGLLDVYYREGQLILLKMLLFLIAGMVFYIYGYYIL